MKRHAEGQRVDLHCYLHSEINSATMHKFIDWLRAVGHGVPKRLHLCINSRGGSVPVTLGVAAFLQDLPLEVTTYNLARCDSAATILFLAGERRVCLSRSTFFMHGLQVELDGFQTLKTLGAEMTSLKADTRSVMNYMGSRSGLAAKQLSAMMSDVGTVVTAKRSLELGLSTEIQQSAFKSEAGLFFSV